MRSGRGGGSPELKEQEQAGLQILFEGLEEGDRGTSDAATGMGVSK